MFDSMVTFTTLINGYCKAGMVDDGVELFCEMGPRGIVANAITYITLIRGFGKVGNINGALDIFQEMISSGVIPDTITIRNMLTSLWSKEELKRAVAMLEDLQMSMLCKSYVFFNIKKNVYMLLCVASD
ncbi:BnaA09g11150D [Brassica napus]|uniref:BnaA09g11150D protein n=1 Tax=Brassica napus TaxID=3708 RepID=A0A078HC66_BRANA|nr:BnaA09g11150D [Brassica napus]